MTSTIIYPEYPCITEWAIANFQPTYLMAKRHTTTGLMYFCKTTGPDPIVYLGSGTHWVRHINKHGRELVETLWYQQFDDILLLVEFALGFSKDANIVASKEWANQIPENGLGGGCPIIGCVLGGKAAYEKRVGMFSPALENIAKRKATFAEHRVQQGEKNNQYGTCWVTNENGTIKIRKEVLQEYLNEGFVRGRRL